MKCKYVLIIASVLCTQAFGVFVLISYRYVQFYLNIFPGLLKIISIFFCLRITVYFLNVSFKFRELRSPRNNCFQELSAVNQLDPRLLRVCILTSQWVVNMIQPPEFSGQRDSCQRKCYFYQKWLCHFILIVKQSMNIFMFYKKGTKKYLVNILTYMVVSQVAIWLKTLEWNVF